MVCEAIPDDELFIWVDFETMGGVIAKVQGHDSRVRQARDQVLCTFMRETSLDEDETVRLQTKDVHQLVGTITHVHDKVVFGEYVARKLLENTFRKNENEHRASH